MTIFGYSISEIRKTLVCVAGVCTSLLVADLLPASWAHWVSTAAGILTVVGTYAVPNAVQLSVPHGRHEAPVPPAA